MPQWDTDEGAGGAPATGGDNRLGRCPIAPARRVDLARVACPNGSGSRDYSRELRAFFDGTSDLTTPLNARGSAAPDSTKARPVPRVVAKGDIIGVWVRSSHSSVGALEECTSSDEEASDELEGRAEGAASLQRQANGAQCKDVAECPGHHLVRFCVVALEVGGHASHGGAPGPGHGGLLVDVAQTIVSCEGTVHTVVPGLPHSAVAHMAPRDLQNGLLELLGPLFHPRTAGLALKVAVLVHGPPGSGKSSGVKAVAALLGVNVLEASCAKFALGRSHPVALLAFLALLAPLVRSGGVS